MSLKLYNTLTRSLEEFTPMDAQNIRMYACGITPYDWSHIGHARSAVAFDVLFRLLKHVYGKDHVTFVRNFTDIDDKIIARANETGEEPTALAARFISAYHEDMAALNVQKPTHEPKVSEHMGGIVKMVDDLIAIGAAYVTPSGDVMYRVAKFPKFGQLARRKIEEQIHGARVQVDAEKEAAEDFVLWKANEKSATKLAQAFNPADYGAKRFSALGRPGWHIECSVMSEALLYDASKNGKDTALFDIHGGGEDLQFPHHCCEIAQSEALHPNQLMANYWVHNAFITVGGKKMSKSLGNFTTIQDALAKYSGEAVRLWLLQTHYRKPVDYSDEALQAMESRLTNIRKRIIADRSAISLDEEEIEQRTKSAYGDPDYEKVPDLFWEALADDLNTPKALSVIDVTKDAVARLTMYHILGIKLFQSLKDLPAVFQRTNFMPEEQKLYDARTAARTAKNWAESDRLRDELLKQGIIVEDGPNGTTWRRA